MPPSPVRLAAAATWGRLQTLLAVIDTGSVRGAADHLQVTPPAVSAAIGALERELGTPLFAKAGRGIVPTSAGVVFAGYARTMLGLLDEASTAVREADRARLRLGAVSTAAEFVLPPLLAAFARTHPGVELSLSVAPRDELFGALHHHEVDLVLAGRPPRGSGLVSRARRPNRLVAVATPPLAATLDRPEHALWLLRGAGSGTLSATQDVLRRLPQAPRTLTVGTHGAAVAAAREGLGITLVHEDAVAADLGAGRLVVVSVPGTPLDRPWHLVAAPRATSAVAAFVAHVTDRAHVGDEAFS